MFHKKGQLLSKKSVLKFNRELYELKKIVSTFKNF